MHIVCWKNLFLNYIVHIILYREPADSLYVKLGTIVILIVVPVFIVASCVVLLWFGRRILCVSSSLGSGIAAVLIGTCVYMQTTHTWIIIGLVLLYVAFSTSGYFVMPPTMIGEILPSNIRCVGGAYIFAMNNIVPLFASEYFLFGIVNVGTHGIFWILGVSSLLSSLFLYLMLPETKGRSLVQIEKYFLQQNVVRLTRKTCQNIRNTII